MNRYKEITWDNFKHGESVSDLGNEVHGVFQSRNIVFNETTIEIAKAFAGEPGLNVINDHANDASPLIMWRGVPYFVAKFDNGINDTWRVYNVSSLAEIAMQYESATANSWSTDQIWGSKNRLFVIVTRTAPTPDTTHLFVSNVNDASVFTEITGQLPTTINNRICFAEIGDTVYLSFKGDNGGEVWSSSDGGLNWIKLFGSLPSDIKIISHGNFLYVYSGLTDFGFNVVINNKELINLNRNGITQAFVFKSNLYGVKEDEVENTFDEVYKFDGEKFDLEKTLPYKFLWTNWMSNDTTYKVYLERTDATDGKVIIYSLDANLALFYEYKLASADYSLYSVQDTLLSGEQQRYISYINQNVSPATYTVETDRYTGAFLADGDISTDALHGKEFVPVEAILRMRPLPTGTSVKVYVETNLSGTWSLLMTATAGEFKKKYKFPNGYGITDVMKFKIELLTTSDFNTPQNVEIKLLYKEIGMETAQ